MMVEVPGMKTVCCNVFTMIISALLSLQACLQSANVVRELMWILGSGSV